MVYNITDKARLKCGYYLDCHGNISIGNTSLNEQTNVSKGGYRYFKPTNRDRRFVSIHKEVGNLFVVNPDPEICTFVDHIDGNRLNNESSNLRHVTPQINSLNKKNTRNCRIIKYDNDGTPVYQWEAYINCGKKYHHISYHWTYEHAHLAAHKYKEELIRTLLKQIWDKYKGKNATT
jgi:hypothetical protein